MQNFFFAFRITTACNNSFLIKSSQFKLRICGLLCESFFVGGFLDADNANDIVCIFGDLLRLIFWLFVRVNRCFDGILVNFKSTLVKLIESHPFRIKTED